MQLKNFACVCVRLRSSACVRLHLRVCVCAQEIKRPDASRHQKFLRPDASFVQGLSGCTICRVHLKHTVMYSLFLEVFLYVFPTLFLQCATFGEFKSYKIICLKETVLITDVSLKNLSHLGLCGALSCYINSIVISDVCRLLLLCKQICDSMQA